LQLNKEITTDRHDLETATNSSQDEMSSHDVEAWVERHCRVQPYPGRRPNRRRPHSILTYAASLAKRLVRTHGVVRPPPSISSFAIETTKVPDMGIRAQFISILFSSLMTHVLAARPARTSTTEPHSQQAGCMLHMHRYHSISAFIGMIQFHLNFSNYLPQATPRCVLGSQRRSRLRHSCRIWSWWMIRYNSVWPYGINYTNISMYQCSLAMPCLMSHPFTFHSHFIHIHTHTQTALTRSPSAAGHKAADGLDDPSGNSVIRVFRLRTVVRSSPIFISIW